jgi:mannose/fructose/N-acetylgalactosamine-specific phosphotransferase system component IID
MASFTKNVAPEDKKILRSMFWRSHLVFQGFTMTKMEANGFTLTMQPAIESIYKDDPEGKKEAYSRHQNFFNTNAVPFSFIAGLAYAMEKQHKQNDSVPGETIDSIKAALMGPTAGMFDSLFFNCMRIIAAGIAIGLCSTGNPIGIPIFILLYGVLQSVIKYIFINIGYTLGTSFIDSIYNSGLMTALTKASSVLGLMMVGAMSATFVNVPLTWKININKASVDVLKTLNSIFPGILSIGLVFLLMYLIRKKHVRPMWLILGVFVFAILGAAIHIF